MLAAHPVEIVLPLPHPPASRFSQFSSLQFLHVYDSKYSKPTGHNYSVDFGKKAEEGIILFTGTEVQDNYELPQISRELYCFDTLEVIEAPLIRGQASMYVTPSPEMQKV